MMIFVETCHACSHEISIGRSVGRRDVCPFCNADLRCCLNCEFFDRNAPKQCREPNAELVKEKARANFCDYFIFIKTRRAGGPASEAGRARKSLDELFKK